MYFGINTLNVPFQCYTFGFQVVVLILRLFVSGVPRESHEQIVAIFPGAHEYERSSLHNASSEGWLLHDCHDSILKTLKQSSSNGADVFHFSLVNLLFIKMFYTFVLKKSRFLTTANMQFLIELNLPIFLESLLLLKYSKVLFINVQIRQ